MQMPRELKRHVPSLVQEIAEGRALASMCLVIYGILFVKVLLNDPNGWVTSPLQPWVLCAQPCTCR